MDNRLKSAVLNSLSEVAQYGEQYFKMDQGDFIGEDGLVYCGKCRQRKQKIQTLPEMLYGDRRTMKVGIMCRCQQEEEENRRKKEEYENNMRIIAKCKDASMMDDKYKEARFENYNTTDKNSKAFRTAERYVQEFQTMFSENQGLLFYGPVGTGKSFTAACIGNALMDKCVPVIMTSFVKILQNIKSGDEAEYLEMLNTAKLLILDDLGTERNTDYALEKVYNVVDSRSRAAMPMILTTNLELGELMKTTDIRFRRIYDRILETCYPVNVPGESFRRKSAAKRFDRMQEMMQEG